MRRVRIPVAVVVRRVPLTISGIFPKRLSFALARTVTSLTMHLAIKLAPLGRVLLITFTTFIILVIVFAISKIFLISSSP